MLVSLWAGGGGGGMLEGCCELISPDSPVEMNGAVAYGSVRSYVKFVCHKRFHNHIFQAYVKWFANRQGINRLELFWLESLELLETIQKPIIAFLNFDLQIHF